MALADSARPDAAPAAETPDNVDHPRHYQGTIETIEFIDQVCSAYAGDEAFSVGSALKYLARAPHKGAKLEDLKKAAWYLNHVIALIENNAATVPSEGGAK